MDTTTNTTNTIAASTVPKNTPARESNPNPNPNTNQKQHPTNNTNKPPPATNTNQLPLPRWQTKRHNTRINQQPGTIFANRIPATPNGYPRIVMSPRKELVATWQLPLNYLRERTLCKLEERKQEQQGTNGTVPAAGGSDGGQQQQKRVPPPQNLTVRDALRSLTVGLFRRGCAENGSTFSIISKEVVPSSSSNSNQPHQHQHPNQRNNNNNGNAGEYHFEINEQNGTIWGNVPFYTPRTPGNVVLRLYFEDEPRITLATSQCVRVFVAEEDLEPTIRFVLSNFKAKKGTTNFSSVHSLAAILEQFTPREGGGGEQQQQVERRGYNHTNNHNPQQYRNTMYDNAGRAAWGCICESRKVLDTSRKEYNRKKVKLSKLEEELMLRQDLLNNAKTNVSSDVVGDNGKEGVEEDAGMSVGVDQPRGSLGVTNGVVDEVEDDIAGDSEGEKEEEALASFVKEKINVMMGERASNERKWREVQSAYASVLRSVLTNHSISLLLKRDVILKIRLEYELWCTFCECFAANPLVGNKNNIAYNNNNRNDSRRNHPDNKKNSGLMNFADFPHPITGEHFTLCEAARAKMQLETLGFVPTSKDIAQMVNLDTIATNNNKNNNGGGGGGGVLEKLSQTMEQLYEDRYAKLAQETIQRKVRARDLTDRALSACEAFPKGTRVVVFGSSANGFGSPKSDLDMCIQLPPSSSLVDKEDVNGSASMGKLAEILEQSGMVDVNTDRLTARIPVVKFNCPIKPEDGSDTAVLLIECDVSMQNPLACINTALLRTYSGILPEVRILAAIVKRWAKARNINDPSEHTLSSYGYIIMLLYFLTTHKTTDQGGIVNVQDKDNASLSSSSHREQGRRRDEEEIAACTIIPNLQWMDPAWLQTPPGTPFKELDGKPSNKYSTMIHPSEPSYTVNTYFHPLNDETTTTALQNHLHYTTTTTRNNEPNNSKKQQTRNTPPVGILLASFFRYYAYEFDYKRHIVSLNATCRYGPIDRESKAETDGWKLYGQALCVEDPFENFYDVAHVLKPVHFQRTRREFALAYAKICKSVAIGGMKVDEDDGTKGGDLLDRICEEVCTGDS